jgi:hypothetical protein
VSSEWTPEAYMKVIDIDRKMFNDAVLEFNGKIMSGQDPRYDVTEALRYAGKLQDNLKLLHQRLNETDRSRT